VNRRFAKADLDLWLCSSKFAPPDDHPASHILICALGKLFQVSQWFNRALGHHQGVSPAVKLGTRILLMRQESR
jgi:hypothetical protein